MAQVAEHILGKDEVTSSNLVSSSNKNPDRLHGHVVCRDFCYFILAAALPVHTAAHRCLGCVYRRQWQCLPSAVCAAARGRAGRRITGCDSLSTAACVTWYRQGDLVMTGSCPTLPRITLRPKGSYPLPIFAFPYVDKCL